MAYPATPKTWVSGDVLTAAQLNAELRNALLGAFPLGPPDAAWTGFTPTLTQSATVTKTVTYAKYQRIGRTIKAAVKLVVTGAGTATNPVLVGLPVAALDNSGVVGVAHILDASGPTRYVVAALGSTTTTVWFAHDTSGTSLFGTAPAVTLAVGDEINLSITYEAAT